MTSRSLSSRAARFPNARWEMRHRGLELRAHKVVRRDQLFTGCHRADAIVDSRGRSAPAQHLRLEGGPAWKAVFPGQPELRLPQPDRIAGRALRLAGLVTQLLEVGSLEETAHASSSAGVRDRPGKRRCRRMRVRLGEEVDSVLPADPAAPPSAGANHNALGATAGRPPADTLR